MMIAANRDVFPDLVNDPAFSSIACLLTNPALDAAFLEYEERAKTAKRRFHTYGRWAIALITLAAIYSVVETIFILEFAGGFWLSLAAALGASLGIVIQLWIFISKQKEKWLLNRFAAERVRSLKFQAYQCAAHARDPEELEQAVKSFTKSSLSELKEELNAGASAAFTFTPRKGICRWTKDGSGTSDELLALARQAFQRLRINYQLRFAQSELERIKRAQRLFSGVEDFLYIAAAIAAVIALGTKSLVIAGLAQPLAIIDFVPIALFILGASVAIINNATLDDPSEVRFDVYVRDLEDGSAKAGDVPFVSLIEDIELICLDELDNFCRSIEMISYRL